MTARLFLGGPADRRWIDTDGASAYRVPVISRVSFGDTPDPFSLRDDIVTYYRYRYRHPAWRIVLTFYVTGDPARRPHRGESMPGWVHGVELEQSPLCRRCRAREASWYWRDGLCFSCFAYEDEE